MLRSTGERFIPQTEQSYTTIIEHLHRYNAVASALTDLEVLDAGSGSGYGSSILAKYAKIVTGLDIAQDAVNFSNQKYSNFKNLSYICGSICEMPFKDNSFDAVVSFEVIEHVSSGMQVSFLREVKRVLKPNGLLIISSPNKAVYSDEIGFQNPYHINELTVEGFKDLIKGHFSFSKYYFQTCEQFSVLYDDDSDKNKEFCLVNICDDGYFHRTYAIAVCSDDNILLDRLDLNSLVIRYNNDYYRDRRNRIFNYISCMYYSSEGEFSEDRVIRKILHVFDGEVEQTYILDQPIYIESVRWDPVELGFCRITDPSISIILENGEMQKVDIENLESNGYIDEEGRYLFSTIDPSFVFKVDNRIKGLHVKAKMEVLNNEGISHNIVMPLMVQKIENSQRLIDSQSELFSIQTQLQDTQTQLQDTQNQLIFAMRRVDDLKYQSEKAEAEYTFKLHQLNSEISRLSKDYIQADNTIKRLLVIVAAKDAEITHLNSRIINHIWKVFKKVLKK